jgi:putative ATP-binding cassette transporter
MSVGANSLRGGLLLTLLEQRSGGKSKRVLAAAVVAGAFEGMALMAVGSALDDLGEGSISFKNFILFLAALAGYYVLYKYAIDKCTSAALGVVQDIQLRLTAAFRRLNLRQFEQLDEGQVYQEIIGNKDIVVEATRYLVVALSGVTLMLFAFLFALLLSPVGFLVIVGCLAVSGLLLSSMYQNVNALQQDVRGLDEKYTLSLKDLLYGFVEIKLNRRKRDELIDDVIHKRAAESYEVKREAEQLYVRGLAFFNTFVFLPVAAIVFILPGFVELSIDVLMKLIGVTLFSLGPLTSIITALPALSKAELMIRGVMAFETRLEQMREEESSRDTPPLSFERIELRDCRFRYETTDGSAPFSIEIDEFRLNRNEIVFITGGNGSGKTSFIKLFASLYTPERGTILVDGTPLPQIGIDAYRSLFSIVLMNFHLFERLYGIGEVDVSDCNRLLSDMQLADKVTLKDGNRFSPLTLSSGQRKRLAVVAALLEKHPILLFDEVAADFDPSFRRYYYEELLPRLKREGRTILAVSHDDRFHHIADRVVTMRYGRIEADIQQGTPS